MSSSSWSRFTSRIQNLSRQSAPTSGVESQKSAVVDAAASLFTRNQKVEIFLQMRPRDGSQGFFDSAGNLRMSNLNCSLGSITIEIFSQKCPLTCFNFLSLCSGRFVLPEQEARNTIHRHRAIDDTSFERSLEPQLHYKGTIFHRVIKGFGVQGGDVVTNNGMSQKSVFGETFQAREEMWELPDDKEGLVLTASSSPDEIGSQFFVVTRKLDDPKYSYLNKSCVCFGQVLSGLEILRNLETKSVDFDQRPKHIDVFVRDCKILS